MRELSYTDGDGRQWMVKLPGNLPDSDARLGIPVGPPSLKDLELPIDLEVAIHNGLFIRKIFTSADIKHRRSDVIDAIRAAYKMDAEKIYVHYLKWEGRL